MAENKKVSNLKLVNSPLEESGKTFSPELTDTLRNLMGLLALPGLWVGRSGKTIVRIISEAIQRTLPIKFIYSEIQLEPNLNYSSLMWNHVFLDGDKLGPWQANLEKIKSINISEGKPVEQIIGDNQLRLVRLSLGYGPTAGTIWLGSSKAGFPTLTDLTFIRAAITLAGTGLLTAKAQQDAERANRAKDEFMAILGHELRNPLAPIMMSLDVLRLKNNGDLPKELSIIERQSKHMAQLVDDLLDVSRITSGKIVLKDDLVNLNQVLANAIENCAPLLNDKLHHFSKKLLSDSQSLVRGDAYRLIQIFTNLLNNAAKFMHERGQIFLSCNISGSMIEVSIQDQGPGISPDLIPNIFNMFEQGKQTIDRSKGGLGIGLSVVRSLVELHLGRVQVESIEGHGAKFSVFLPLAAEAELISTKVEKVNSPKLARKILLVDDNEDILQSLSEYLDLIGYIVAKANNPNDALLQVHDFEPEIVILDIGLPQMSGYELAGLIKSGAKNRPFLIALTGYGQQKDIAASKQAGFDIHLTKPVALEELEAALLKLSS